MRKLKQRMLLVVSHVIVGIAVYYAAPYIKETPVLIIVGLEKKHEKYTDSSKKDLDARLAVVIEDQNLTGDKEKDIQWADDFRRKQFTYSQTKKGLGHTAFIFEVLPPNESLAIK